MLHLEGVRTIFNYVLYISITTIAMYNFLEWVNIITYQNFDYNSPDQQQETVTEQIKCNINSSA